MKWIAVILVMLNLVVFLWMKSSPDPVQAVSQSEFETINESAMSVLPPEQQLEAEDIVTEGAVAEDTVAEVSSDLVEDDLAQLKMDDRGKVLMARKSKAVVDGNTADSNAAKSKKGIEKAAMQSTSVDSMIASAEQDARVTAKPVLKPLDRREKAPAMGSAASVANTKVKPESKPKPKTNTKASPPPASVVVEAKACYRIGPFTNQNQLSSLRRKLESAGLAYTVEDKTAKGKIKAVRVYLGAFADANALAAQKTRLNEMKIDHFVIGLNGEQLIQLGYFTKPSGAKSRQQELLAKNIKAKTMTEYSDTRIESWLNLKSASGASIKALGLPSGMSKQTEACR